MKILIAVLTAATLTACGFNPDRCRAVVQKVYGTADVQPVPDREYTFVARKKDGSVWIVKCNNITNYEISSEIMLFGPIESK